MLQTKTKMYTSALDEQIMEKKYFKSIKEQEQVEDKLSARREYERAKKYWDIQERNKMEKKSKRMQYYSNALVVEEEKKRRAREEQIRSSLLNNTKDIIKMEAEG